MVKENFEVKKYVRYERAYSHIKYKFSKAIEGYGEFDYNTSNNTFSISLNDNTSTNKEKFEEIKKLAVSLLQTMGATAYELSRLLDWKPFEK